MCVRERDLSWYVVLFSSEQVVVKYPGQEIETEDYSKAAPGAVDGGGGGDGLGVEGVHVLARRQHVGVPDRVPTGARGDVLAVERVDQRTKLLRETSG